MRRFSLLIVFIPAFASAQEKKEAKVEPIPEVKIDRADPVLYEKDVEPILANKCFVCHSGKELNGKLDMGSYEKLIKGAIDGMLKTLGLSHPKHQEVASRALTVVVVLTIAANMSFPLAVLFGVVR